MDACELAQLVGAQASCREVVEAHLARIDQVNPAINALTVILGEEARSGPRGHARLDILVGLIRPYISGTPKDAGPPPPRC
jgi:amidase